MKVKPSVKPICEKCKIIKRRQFTIMKNKIFKLLSVVMALAMVFTMFACVSFAEEAPAQDVIVDNTGRNSIESLGVVTLAVVNCA